MQVPEAYDCRFPKYHHSIDCSQCSKYEDCKMTALSELQRLKDYITECKSTGYLSVEDAATIQVALTLCTAVLTSKMISFGLFMMMLASLNTKNESKHETEGVVDEST